MPIVNRRNVYSGISNAVLAITAYNYGAAKPDRIMKTLWYGTFASVAIMTIGTGAFHLVPEKLLGFFNPIAEIAFFTFCVIMMIILYRKKIRNLGK